MKGLTKTFPGAAKPVLNNIHLQFLPGTKIAIIGVNGAGKSTLMKIMAGYDTEYQGEAWAAEGIRVGYLAQEPQLDPSKDVRGNVMDGVRPVADMLDRFNAISALMADPPEDADFDALLAEMGELQEKIDAVDGWTLARRATGRWTIFRAVSGGASRSADCCSRSPKSCCSTSLPTTSTRRASSGWKSI
jgi:ATPase subunit of ABC transporter with duplicated ATPase domains